MLKPDQTRFIGGSRLNPLMTLRSVTYVVSGAEPRLRTGAPAMSEADRPRPESPRSNLEGDRANR